MIFDWNLAWLSLPILLEGVLLTIHIAVSSCLIGVILGTFFGVTGGFFVRVYVILFRGTPMLVQIYFAYFVLPQLGVSVSPLWAATIAIGLNSAAYICEIVRSGIQSVPKGQVEAAATLGLSQFQTTRYIVLPQAIRNVLPAIGNEFITLVKDSSLASIIGVVELSKQASVIRSRTYDALTILVEVAVIYLVLTTTVSLIVNKMERKYDVKN